MDKEKIDENKERIDSYLELKENWNGYGATPFSDSLLGKVKEIVLKLSIQPDIFPTARMSIQCEFETNVKYLEFEIWEDKVEYYYKDEDSEEDGTITKGINEMEDWIKRFQQ